MSFEKDKAELQAKIALDKIKTNVLFEEAKQQNLSPLETARKLMADLDMEYLGKTIKVVNIMVKFLEFIPRVESPTSSKSFEGYCVCVRGEMFDSEEHNVIATEWNTAFEGFKTVKNVLDWVLEKEGVGVDTLLYSYPGEVDKEWFMRYVQTTSVMDHMVLAFSEKEHQTLLKETMEMVKTSQESVEEKEHIHKTLMTD